MSTKSSKEDSDPTTFPQTSEASGDVDNAEVVPEVANDGDNSPNTAQGQESKPEVQVIKLPTDQPNPFQVLGLDLTTGRTLTMDDFLLLPTATEPWEKLTQAQRTAYEQLGFDPSGKKHTEMRCIKILDGTAEMHWGDLSEEQKQAAIELGCDENGIRHEMGRLATIANRLLLKDEIIKQKKWDELTPAQQAAAQMLGHDNNGKIWNVRVEREWCKDGVSPNSSLQNPFALPKGVESLIRIAKNMGIDIAGMAPRLKKLCVDTDDDIILQTVLQSEAISLTGAQEAGGISGGEHQQQIIEEEGNTKENSNTSHRLVVIKKVIAVKSKRFDPEELTVAQAVNKCTKLEMTVTEPGTIGMRWDDHDNGIVTGVTEGLPASLLGVRPGCQVVAVQGEWVEPKEAFTVLMSHVMERPFKVKFKLPQTETD